jgi:hypothetical protein
LLPRFTEVWTIPPREGQAVGNTWETAIKTIPEEQRSERLIRTIEGLPWVNALATTILVLAPRINYTVRNWRNRTPGPFEYAQDVPAAVEGREMPAEDAPPPAAAPRGDGALAGGGYVGEQRGEFATIDGSEAA